MKTYQEVKGFSSPFEGRGVDLLLSSVEVGAEEGIGALAPDQERKEFPSCQQRGKQSFLPSREIRASLLSCWGRGPARGSLLLSRSKGGQIGGSFFLVFDGKVENLYIFESGGERGSVLSCWERRLRGHLPRGNGALFSYHE